jgi:hypothetical protein
LEIPLADPVGSPKHVSADYYYRIPVAPIYKSRALGIRHLLIRDAALEGLQELAAPMLRNSLKNRLTPR